VEIRNEKQHCDPENIAYLVETNTQLKEENAELKISLEESEKVVNILREQIRLNKLRYFGRKAEDSEHLQLELVFDEEPQNEEVGDPQEEANETITYTRKKKL
jgi:hypothetical protein